MLAKPEVLIAVVDDPIPGKKAGGVQILAGLIVRQAGDSGVAAIITTTKTALDDLSELSAGRKIIFVQTNGRLSPEYRLWALDLLNNGIEIIEENIFALASRYRPSHPNYKMALMSEDGAYRYSFRSFWAFTIKSPNYIKLPNPLLHKSLKKINPDAHRGAELSFLRVGRPDPIKWSTFEFEFLNELARQVPYLSLKLVLVGSPDRKIEQRLKAANLSIENLEYQQDLSKLYLDADFYIHHSSIGESFGNTIVEAFVHDLPILYAADLHWDQAPVEVIPNSKIVWSTPELLRGNAKDVFKRLEGMRASNENRPKLDTLDLESYLNLLISGDLDSQLRKLPSATSFFPYLLRLRRSSVIRISLLRISQAVVFEALRALKNLIQRDQ